MPETPAASFCATLVDEWVRAGLRHAVIAPGSRSTPLAVALAMRSELELHLVHDERAASFLALGIGRSTGIPAILLCTSGTAAVEFHAAVVEAHQAEVALVVCTADRPPELRDVGAAQTVDQLRLYGPAVRWFHDPGVPEPAQATGWRALASRSVHEATGRRPGPVHLNLPFREPLIGESGALPPAREEGPWLTVLTGPGRLGSHQLAALVDRLERQRGVIIAGEGPGIRSAAESIHQLACQLGWPVLADPRSGCRLPLGTTVAAFDSVLRHRDFASAHAPEVVLRFGAAPASKVLSEWVVASGAMQIHVGASGSWLDPDHRVAARVVADPGELCSDLDGQMVGASRTPWLARWRRAEARAQRAITFALDGHPELCEPAIARRVVFAVPDGGHLVVSSSMPVRDVEWYGAPRRGLTVHSNRGANGIDGVIATAIGVAIGSAAPTALLIGDVAFVHDSAALVALSSRRSGLTMVVVDNDGGGIFSFLPQASALPTDRFELLFGTPHGTDVAGLAAAHSLPYHHVDDLDELGRLVERGGTGVVHARTDRVANVRIHDEVHAAVGAALDT